MSSLLSWIIHIHTVACENGLQDPCYSSAGFDCGSGFTGSGLLLLAIAAGGWRRSGSARQSCLDPANTASVKPQQALYTDEAQFACL